MADPSGTHTEHEVDDWTVVIPDHPRRTESPGFRRAKDALHRLLRTVEGDPLIASMTGPRGIQAHHAGSLWVFDGHQWTLLLNAAGIEWSAQWAADPAKVDRLRQAAARVYERFPETLDEFGRLGYPEARQILSEPITDHAGVARWTDSLFNSCVPLSPELHQAYPSSGRQVAGWHHVPKSIWDCQLTKRDDFRLWVTDERDGHTAAVLPVAEAGSGDQRVAVVWTHPASRLGAEALLHAAAGKPHILTAGHPLARQAFAGSRPAPAGEAA